MKFFALTFALTWSFWLAAARFHQPALIMIGVFMPAVAAIVLAGTAPLRGFLQPGVGARWYLFAVTYFVVIKLTVAVIHRIVLGAWPRFGSEPWYVIAGAIVLSTPVQAGEEIGWRGYALPRLAARLGMARASLLLGAIWALWHLPLFFIPGLETYRQSFGLYLLQVTAISAAMAWLYVKTKGSLLLIMLMHAAVNNTKDIVPSLGAPAVAWTTAALLWICAALFLTRISSAAAAPAPLPDATR